jgi:DNA adenine methylase
MTNLVKWAGGKALLAAEFEKHLKLDKNSFYVEPFLGGGGSFLQVNKGFGAGSDLNKSLICLWEFVRDDLDSITSGYAYYHDLHSAGGYKDARDQYNNLYRDKTKVEILEEEEKRDIAILFLYLLNTGYNGLCRYSAKTGFNVPVGDKLPSIQSVREKLLIVQDKIKNSSFHCWDFTKTIKHYQAKGNVFFYCDPPYSKVNGKGFQSYTGEWKGTEDADRLKQVLIESGSRFAVSEIDCPEVRERYADYPMIEILANRSIGGNRSKVSELLILSQL